MYPTTMNFAKVNEVPIVIIYTKFGEDRSISLVSAGSRISPLCLHLTTSHYNIACTTVQLVIISTAKFNQFRFQNYVLCCALNILVKFW